MSCGRLGNRGSERATFIYTNQSVEVPQSAGGWDGGAVAAGLLMLVSVAAVVVLYQTATTTQQTEKP